MQDGTPKSSDRLKAGEVIQTNGTLRSPNRKYALILQGDGNFVLYIDGGSALWASNTGDYRKAVKGLLQDDGNLRLFDESNREKWSSRTGGEGNASSVLIIQDDGNVVINSDGKVIWETETKQKEEEREKPKPAEPVPTGPTRDRLLPGESLNIDQRLTSPSGEYTLIMQNDYNCVLYRKDKGALWAKGSGAGIPSERLNFRADGELEVVTGSGGQRWVSGTAGRGNSSSFFAVRDDGNMVISTDGQIVWTSGTGAAIPVGKTDHINGGGRLLPGEMLTSPNGNFTLVFQGDSNFVLYEGSTAKWSSGGQSYGSGGGWAQVDKEGNMATFADQRVLWSSRTRYRKDAGDTVLSLQDDGAAVLKLDGIVIWSTNGSLVQPYEPRDFEVVTSGNQINPGQFISVIQSLTSQSGKISAFVVHDGQFIVRSNETKDILFTSNKPTGITASKLTVGYNDDIILWGWNGSKLWQNTPSQSSRAGLVDQDDRYHRSTPGSVVLNDKGNLNLYGSNFPNACIWSSDSAYPAFTGNVSALKPGETLLVGQKMLSPNGDHELSLQPSGYLRIHNTRFNSDLYYFTIPESTVQDARYLSFGRDFAVEIRGADNRSLWRAEVPKRDPRDRHEDRYNDRMRPEPPGLILDNDANVYSRTDDGGHGWWISNLPSGRTERQTSIGDTLRPDVQLTLDKYLRSNNSNYMAKFDNSGEFVLLSNHDGGPGRRGQKLWGTKTGNTEWLKMGSDGNLLAGVGGDQKWSSNTGGHQGQGDAALVVQDDGNMCIYVGGNAIFATGTSGGWENYD